MITMSRDNTGHNLASTSGHAGPGNGDYLTRALLLAALVIAAETASGYRKADWWTHWADEDHDCQDTRQEVLAAQSVTPARWTPDGCKVVVGWWVDPYTGETTSRPSDLDIDHLV